jgi:hypothetical protein
MCHPSHPPTADLSREASATDRDLADLVALRELRRIVADAIARASRLDRIHHPDARWSGAPELVETLEGELANVDAEVERIRHSPLVIENEDY